MAGETLRLLRSRRRRAVVLILVLWIATVLGLLAYSVLYQTTMETRLTSMRKKTVVARAVARAGVARAFVDLKNDMIFDSADDEDPPFDAEGDVWARPDEGKTDIELDGGTFSVTVIDEERYFNLTRMASTNRPLLEKIIERIGYSEENAKIVASAIVDYQDEDDVPALDSAPQGDEGFAYGMVCAEIENTSRREEEIKRANFPDEPYMTVEALLDVFGVTPELFFGPGTPEAEHYRATMPPQPWWGEFEIRDSRRRDADEVFGLRDYFTVYGTGRLNMNTAPVHVLAALFDAAGASDPDRLAERILRNRRGGRDERIDNDRAYKMAQDLQADGDLAPVLGPSGSLVALGVSSTTFRIISTGRTGDVVKTLEVLVNRNLVPLQRSEDFESIDRAREREDRMEGRMDRRRDRDNELLVRLPNVRILLWEQI